MNMQATEGAAADRAEWTRRGVASVRIMVEFAERHGVGALTLLAGSGLTAQQLDDHHQSVRSEQELVVVRNLTRALGNGVGLAMQLGMRYRITAFGTLGLLWLSCQQIRDALLLGVRFQRLSFALTRVRVEVERGEARVNVEDEHLPEDLRDFVLHRDIAALATLRSELTQARPSYRCLQIRAPFSQANLPLYHALWGVRPTFGAARNMAAYPDSFLDVSLLRWSALTLRACIASCERALREHEPEARTSLPAEVRARLLEPRGLTLSMDATARTLAMTSRTLRRQLALHGTSYRALVDGARVTVGSELLCEGRLTLVEIAARLGYADKSSFVQGFRRLTGSTPMQLRRAGAGPSTSAR